jgi:type IV pilus assembly protein PilX
MGRQYSFQHKQTGVALFMSLIMLLIITVLGLSSVKTTTLQERMARNARDSNLAFLAAESALKDAEAMIEGFNTLDGDFGIDPKEANPRQCLASPLAGSGLYYELDYNCQPNWETVDWEGDSGFITSTVVVEGVNSQPKYIIEHVKTLAAFEDRLNLTNIGEDLGAGRVQIFRVTAYGTGGTDSARAMIQSTYGRSF